MDRITAAEVFVTIVERGSMIEAAKVLDMSRSMVTRYLNEMETWSNARLLHRSTRRLSLTSSGESVLEHCRQLLRTADELAALSSSSTSEPSGVIRISCSQFVAEDILVPDFVKTLHQRYPTIVLDLHIADQRVDLIEERIDLAIRIAQELDPSLISRKLGNCESTICASPAYLQSTTAPTRPEDLGRLNCLTYSYFEDGIWRLGNDDTLESVSVSGNFSANGSGSLLRATLAGCGVSMLPSYAVRSFLQAGELVELLPDYPPQSMGIHVVYHSREHMPRTTRTVIDALVEHFDTLTL